MGGSRELNSILIEAYMKRIEELAKKYHRNLNRDEIKGLKTEKDYYIFIYGFFDDLLQDLQAAIDRERVYTTYLELREEYKKIYKDYEYLIK